MVNFYGFDSKSLLVLFSFLGLFIIFLAIDLFWFPIFCINLGPACRIKHFQKLQTINELLFSLLERLLLQNVVDWYLEIQRNECECIHVVDTEFFNFFGQSCNLIEVHIEVELGKSDLLSIFVLLLILYLGLLIPIKADKLPVMETLFMLEMDGIGKFL